MTETQLIQVSKIQVGDRITEKETPQGPFYKVVGFPTKSRSKITVKPDGIEPVTIPCNRYWLFLKAV